MATDGPKTCATTYIRMAFRCQAGQTWQPCQTQFEHLRLGTTFLHNVRREFWFADKRRAGFMIPVVMEERMKDQSNWSDSLLWPFPAHLYKVLPADEDAEYEAAVAMIAQAIFQKTETALYGQQRSVARKMTTPP